eukprot:CAMPEP_0169186104 /NCGR_PEP_ID=MMETSP1016-20121227/2171_1 /TAXON_ID=342587 /ORGANISM="Karlodinium micrum, Strain CCMP2283" /LENGTH=135 /DNA_ID=CAMNT_0009261891 /DNA_START=38 /DNA_END=445 /DNA_ORIENTATION=+
MSRLKNHSFRIGPPTNITMSNVGKGRLPNAKTAVLVGIAGRPTSSSIGYAVQSQRQPSMDFLISPLIILCFVALFAVACTGGWDLRAWQAESETRMSIPDLEEDDTSPEMHRHESDGEIETKGHVHAKPTSKPSH